MRFAEKNAKGLDLLHRRLSGFEKMADGFIRNYQMVLSTFIAESDRFNSVGSIPTNTNQHNPSL
jgi:hypothetical protein